MSIWPAHARRVLLLVEEGRVHRCEPVLVPLMSYVLRLPRMRFLVIVLVVQALLAIAFIVLVATDNVPFVH